MYRLTPFEKKTVDMFNAFNDFENEFMLVSELPFG